MTTSAAESADGPSSLGGDPAVLVGERLLGRSSDGTVQLNAVVLPPTVAEAVLSGGLSTLPPHPHLETLVDVGAHREGTMVLTGPPVMTTLERVLASGRTIAPGIVVTMLAPIVAALQEAARHGVHPAPGADAVGLTAEGRPVLLLSRCESAGSEASARDAVRVLLARCRQRCPDWPGTMDDDIGLAEMEAELYRSAAPEPVGELLTATPVALVPATEGERRRCRHRIAARVASWRRRSTSPGGTAPPVAPDGAPPARHRRPHPFDDWRRRTFAFVKRRRGPLAVAAAVLLGAGLTTGVGGGTASSPPESHFTPSAIVSAQTTDVATPEVPPPDTSPEDAATLLVGAAQECDDDTRCLHAITTPDSPLRSTNAPAAAEALQEGTEVDGVVTDVNGASALVALRAGPETTAASVLMIRTEAGWLIRDVFGDGHR